MGEFHALVLAAGAGSRFGGRKLLAPWRGGPLLCAALDATARAPVTGITVVTGADAGEVSHVADEWARRRGETRLKIIHAVDHHEGLAASLRAGIDAVPGSADACFIFLGDMPRIPYAILPDMALALTGDRLAVAPFHDGRRGHPVLVSRPLFPRLRALTGDVGAKAVIDGLGEKLGAVRAESDGVLFDVDLVTDLHGADVAS